LQGKFQQKRRNLVQSLSEKKKKKDSKEKKRGVVGDRGEKVKAKQRTFLPRTLEVREQGFGGWSKSHGG